MIFYGYFNNVDNSNTYYVRIGNTGAEIEIKHENPDNPMGDICFSWDPVTINSDREDTFSNVYSRTCKIRLTSDYNIYDNLTAIDFTDLPVEIHYDNEEGELIFSGYVEPLILTQDYSNVSNEIELNCVDKFKLLENYKLKEISGSDFLFEDYITPRTVINFILSTLGFDSISYNISNDKTEDTYINPAIFIGESQDDWMDCKQVLEEIGKIYGCWFYQNGNTCIVENILTRMESLKNNNRGYTLQKKDFHGDDTNISLSENYKRVKLTCDIETPDSTIINPFDDDYMVSDFSDKYHYMTEIVAPGEGSKALECFKNMIRRGSSFVDGYKETPQMILHYCQVYRNPLLDFGSNNYTQYNTQRDVLDFLHSNTNKGAFIAWGKSDNIADPKNSEGVHSVDMTKTLVISVNGQSQKNYSRLISAMNNNPIFSVTLPSSTNFVPNDISTTNYLVISGSIFLNPLQPKTGGKPGQGDYPSSSIEAITGVWWKIDSDEINYIKSTNTTYSCTYGWGMQRTHNYNTDDYTMWHRTVPHEHDDGAYYQMRFTDSTGENFEDNRLSSFGEVNNSKQKKYQYKFNSQGQARDTINKVQVLACQMKIGSKYLIERLDQRNGMNKFEWVAEDNLPEIDGGRLDYFTIGFNPKIDDYIIGQKHDIADTRDVKWNLDKKGTCIPISYDDNLHGEITFKILGPVPSTWTNTREVKHGWWFWSSTKYPSNEIFIMEQLENILLTNFKIDLVSDNGRIGNNLTDNDLVYYSKSNDIYQTEQEYETKFCTSLTSKEASNLGIDYNLTNSSIMEKVIENEEEKLVPFYGFDYYSYVTSYTYSYTKLEEARVFEQYNLWDKPRRIVETTLKLKEPENFTYNCKYRFNNTYWGFNSEEEYQIISEEISLRDDTMKVKLKNI